MLSIMVLDHGPLAALSIERCGLCGGLSRSGFCEPCEQELPRVRAPCAVCGVPDHPLSADHGPGWYLAGVIAPFQHAFPIRELIHRLKYRGHRYLGRCLGAQLARDVSAAHRNAEVVMPIPLHRRRLIERGYNQSFELARTIAAAWSLPLWTSGIRRQRATLPQTGLTLTARRANVRSAFQVTSRVAGRRVLLVDDVITTGATANALAAGLLAAGAVEVRALAVARG